MTRPQRNRPLVIALYANAALLAAILLVLLSRGNGQGLPSFLPAAYGAPNPAVPPLAGNGNQFIMPAQLATNNWGCYLLDTDAQTLCVYQFFPTGGGNLRLVAARRISFDRKLWDFNSDKPRWTEVEELVKNQNLPPRGAKDGSAPRGDDK